MGRLLTGQITVTTAGTAVQGPATPRALKKILISAHPGNTGNAAYGNDGANDVTMLNGMVLAPGDVRVINLEKIGLQDLSELWFDAATNGDKFCWQVYEG